MASCQKIWPLVPHTFNLYRNLWFWIYGKGSFWLLLKDNSKVDFFFFFFFRILVVPTKFSKGFMVFSWNCFNFPMGSQSVPQLCSKNNNRKWLAKNGLHPHGPYFGTPSNMVKMWNITTYFIKAILVTSLGIPLYIKV